MIVGCVLLYHNMSHVDNSEVDGNLVLHDNVYSISML